MSYRTLSLRTRIFAAALVASVTSAMGAAVLVAVDERDLTTHLLLVVPLLSLVSSASACAFTVSGAHRPLRRLVLLASRVVEEDRWDLRAERESEDEVGEIADRFNQVLDHFERRGRHLEQNHARVEQEMARQIEELRKYSAVVTQSPMTVVVTDPLGKVEYVNPRFSQVTGYEPEEAIRTNERTLKAGDLEPVELEKLLRTVAAGGVWRGEFQNRKKNGRLFWESATVAGLRGPDGDISHYLWLKEEITERRLADQALRESEAQLRAVTGTAKDAIVMVDQDSRVRVWNRAAARIFGYSEDEVLGKPLQPLLIPTRYHASFERAFRRFVESGHVPNMGRCLVGEALCKDGSEVPVELSVGGLRVEGRWSAVAIVRDVTDRKRAEQEREEMLEIVRESNRSLEELNARLVRSNVELRDFAHLASHDLEEPLRELGAVREELVEMVGDSLDEEAQQHLERIESVAARMQRLTDDLLTFSRVASQAHPFERVDLTELVREVVGDLRSQIEESAGRVEVGELPVVEADRSQIRQLLRNLIGNGLKFCRQGERAIVSVRGRVLTEAPYLGHFGPAAPRPRVCEIEIQDNGLGFDENQGERIFGVSQELHGWTRYEGSGVGLAVCRKIVDRHGGHISARSSPGEGATFTVVIPVRQRKEEAVVA